MNFTPVLIGDTNFCYVSDNPLRYKNERGHRLYSDLLDPAQ